MRSIFCAVVLTLSAGTAEPAEFANLVVRGGPIVVCDATDLQAEALAVGGSRIIAVGTAAEINQLVGPDTRVIDLGGRTLVPGFIEGHGHLLSLGELRMGIDLTTAADWDHIVEMVAAAAEKAEPGDWIIGRGWHQEKWRDAPPHNADRYPHHDRLSAATPRNPVLLVHASGHMVAANKLALDLAGISDQSVNPAGGEILRDDQGQPTGVLRETAQRPVYAAYDDWLERRSEEEVAADRLRAFQLAAQECLAHGVTSFQDAGSSFDDVEFFAHLETDGQLPIRLWVMLRASPDELRAKLAGARRIGEGDDPRLTVRAIKCMADGALGSHGAWMLEPYDDLPDSRGLPVQPLSAIRETALLALQHDYQLCTHAIGDRANRAVLDLYEQMLRSRPDSDLRWRIEHAQHLHPDDIPRFADLGVIASMQGVHATSDGPYVVARLGSERARLGAYAWRSLLDAGVRIVNGTDVPVEPIDPLKCLAASITRRMSDGRQFFPEQCMTRLEALHSYTRDAAYAAFEEQDKGSLEVGKLADLVVLSANPLTVPADKIADIRVELTIVAGQVAFERATPSPN